MRALRLFHQRQNRASHAQNSQHIDLEHRFPIFILSGGHRVKTVCPARIVDQNIHPFRDGPAPVRKFIHAGSFRHIKKMRLRIRRAELSAFVCERVETVNAACAQKKIAPLARKRSRGRGAEP